MHAVSAHQIACTQDAFIVEPCAHARRILREILEQARSLHRPAELVKTLQQYALGDGLRHHQGVGIARRQVAEIDGHQHPVAVPDGEASGFEAAPNQLRYRVLVMQGGGGTQQFAGNLQLRVNMVQGGKGVTINFPEGNSADQARYRLAFKYYQRVEGLLTIPEGAIVKSVAVRVLDRGQVRAQQSVDLCGDSRFTRKTNSTIDSLIGMSTSITGDVGFKGGLRIDGAITGNINAETGQPSVLVISEHAKVVGEVRAAHLIVNGEIVGDVHSTELLELQPKARITGNVFYKALEMHGGGTGLRQAQP